MVIQRGPTKRFSPSVSVVAIIMIALNCGSLQHGVRITNAVLLNAIGWLYFFFLSSIIAGTQCRSFVLKFGLWRGKRVKMHTARIKSFLLEVIFLWKNCHPVSMMTLLTFTLRHRSSQGSSISFFQLINMIPYIHWNFNLGKFFWGASLLDLHRISLCP